MELGVERVFVDGEQLGNDGIEFATGVDPARLGSSRPVGSGIVVHGDDQLQSLIQLNP